METDRAGTEENGSPN